MTRNRCQAVFVNSGVLGHRAVAQLIADAVRGDPSIDARHVDVAALSGLGERALRWILCAQLLGRRGFGRANLDLARWRQELHVGLAARRRLRALERDAPIDVLHFHTQATAYASLSRMRAVPSIVSIDITQSLARLEVGSALGRATYGPNVLHDGAVFRRARAIVATSRWAAADLTATYPSCAGNVLVLPYPVRLDAADPAWIDERAARTSLAPQPPVRALFMGGDFERKGGPELLAAWAGGGFAGRAELTLVTDWPLDPRRLPPGVRLVPGVQPYSPRWRDVWRQADLFVLPTRGEAFGMVLQEAAAAGLPVVSTRLNAVPEIVSDGETGILVPPRDGVALAAAMQALVESADLRRTMGAAARDRIARTGSPAAYSDALRALIHRVAAGAGACA